MDTGILYVVFNKWIRNPESNEIPYKIGITRGSVDDRYYGLGLKMPGKFETLFAYKFEECARAEQLIHGILNKKRENGEWFSINQKEIDHIKATCELMDGILVTDEVEVEIKTETGIEIGIQTKTGDLFVQDSFQSNNNIYGGKITGKDILNMKEGDSVLDFFNLIVNSKNPNSENWAGEEYKINNTPMKGINWIGDVNKPLAVIIKTTGKYTEDSTGEKYAFEAKNGCVDKAINSNQVLINQKIYNYPILCFIKNGSRYTLTGKYSVGEIFDTYVTLIPYKNKVIKK